MTKPRKQAIVTGGAKGIGAEICVALGEAGYRVGVLDFDIEAARETVSRLPDAIALQADVTSETSVEQAARAFDAVPDLLVNNAGITQMGGMMQDVATFRRIVEVNLIGPFIVARAFAPGMLARGSGSIVNITSASGSAALPSAGAYGPSKAGLVNLTKTMALEFADRGVRVNSVAPGTIDCGIGARTNAADPDLRAARGAMVPLGAPGTGREIADVVAFLASDQASYITGQDILVDGGLTLTAISRALPRDR